MARDLPPEEEAFARLVVRNVLGSIPPSEVVAILHRGGSLWGQMGGLERGMLRTAAGIYSREIAGLTGAKLAEALLLEFPTLHAALGPGREFWLERQLGEIRAALTT